MLDCGALIPFCKLIFAHRFHHPVPDAVKEVFADAGTGFTVGPRNMRINDAGNINILVDLLRQPESAEFLDLKRFDLRSSIKCMKY